MELLGDANWWFPGWLDWLPRVQIEGKELPVEAASAPADEDRALEPDG